MLVQRLPIWWSRKACRQRKRRSSWRGAALKMLLLSLLALSKQDYKVGRAGQRRGWPATQILPQSFRSVRRTSRASGRWRQSSTVCCICRPQARGRQRPYYHRFDADLCRKSQLYYGRAGLPRAGQGGGRAKKAVPLAPSEKASNERGSISTASQERTTDDAGGPPCWGKLGGHAAALRRKKHGPHEGQRTHSMKQKGELHHDKYS